VKRGDVVVVALYGDLGKPRPAVIMQSDIFGLTHSIGLIPITSTLMIPSLLRLAIEPNPTNGLRVVSQVMIDKGTTTQRSKVRQIIGTFNDDQMREIAVRLSAFFGLV